MFFGGRRWNSKIQQRQKGRRLQNREGERVQVHEPLARVHEDADFPVARPNARGARPEVAVLPAPLLVHDILLVSLPLLDAVAPELRPEGVIHPDIVQTHEPVQRVAILEDLVRPVTRVEPIRLHTARHRTVARQAVLVVGVAVGVARDRELDRLQRNVIRLRVCADGDAELPIARLRIRQPGPEVAPIPTPDRIHVDLVTDPGPHVLPIAVRVHTVGMVDLHVRDVDQGRDVVTLLERGGLVVAGVDPVRLGPARDRTLTGHAIRAEVELRRGHVRLHEHIGVVPLILDAGVRGITAVVPATIAGEVFLVLAVLTLVDAEVDVGIPTAIAGFISQVPDRRALADALADLNLQAAGKHMTHDRRHTFGASPALQDHGSAVANLALGQLDHARAGRFDGRADVGLTRQTIRAQMVRLVACTPELVAVGLPVVERPLKRGRLARSTDGQSHAREQVEECEKRFTTHVCLRFVRVLFCEPNL